MSIGFIISNQKKINTNNYKSVFIPTVQCIQRQDKTFYYECPKCDKRLNVKGSKLNLLLAGGDKAMKCSSCNTKFYITIKNK